MERRDLVLAVLAASNGARHSPVQVQKLFFLVDQRVASKVGGPHFEFVPYDYGPFDRAVYDELRQLEADGLVEIGTDGRYPSYALTPAGQVAGDTFLNELPPQVVDYIRRLSDFVRSLSFSQLVSVIYREYPSMRANSVFQEPA